MIRFTYTAAQRDAIKEDVRRLDDAALAEIEAAGTVHIERDKVMRSLPTQLAFRRALTDKREDAERLRDWIDGSRAFWCRHNGYAPDNDLLVATDAYFAKLLRNIDGIIAALGPPRKKTGSAASRNIGRDLFVLDLFAIWRQIGGKEKGAEAADFLIAVSEPVFDAMPPKTRDAFPNRLSVIKWLRCRSRQG
jgi:hypothetical protein